MLFYTTKRKAGMSQRLGGAGEYHNSRALQPQNLGQIETIEEVVMLRTTRKVEMLGLRVLSAAVAVLMVLLTSACGDVGPPEATPTGETAAEVTTADEASVDRTATEETMIDESTAEESSENVPAVAELRNLDPHNFDDSSINIDNEWFPLQPGTQWTYEGLTVEDGEESPHRVVFTVTDLTKVIEGVRTVVVWDQDFDDGELVEAEIAFFAQDRDGTVWHLGQYPEEYEGGEFVDAPNWVHGLAGAKAGIAMKAEPQLGTPSYYQGWAPAVDWNDYAQVDQMGQETCVSLDCYEDVLVTVETSLDEPGAFQLKYYAPGVGNVRVGWRGDDATQEELELVEFTQLDEEAMADARAEALALEQHAYEISPGVYAHTEPAVPVAETP